MGAEEMSAIRRLAVVLASFLRRGMCLYKRARAGFISTDPVIDFKVDMVLAPLLAIDCSKDSIAALRFPRQSCRRVVKFSREYKLERWRMLNSHRLRNQSGYT